MPSLTPNRDSTEQEQLPPELESLSRKEQLQAMKLYYLSCGLEIDEVVRKIAEIVHVKFESDGKLVTFCNNKLFADEDASAESHQRGGNAERINYGMLFSAIHRSLKLQQLPHTPQQVQEDVLSAYGLREGESLAASLQSQQHDRVEVLAIEVGNWLRVAEPVLSYGKGMVPRQGRAGMSYNEATDEFLYHRPSQDKVATVDQTATALLFTPLLKLPDTLRVCYEEVDQESIIENGWPSIRPVMGYRIREWNRRERSLSYSGGATLSGSAEEGYRTVDDLFRFLLSSGLAPVAGERIELVHEEDGNLIYTQEADSLLRELERWKGVDSPPFHEMRIRFEYVRRGFPLEQYEEFLSWLNDSE